MELEELLKEFNGYLLLDESDLNPDYKDEQKAFQPNLDPSETLASIITIKTELE